MNPGLSEILSGARAVLFDFDGPICSVFAGSPAHSVAAQLHELLGREGYESDASEDDPLEVLRQSERLGQAVVRRIEDALTAAEIAAIGTARPTRGGDESLAACARSGRRTAIVTNNSPWAVTIYLDNHGLTDLVHAVVGRPYAEPQRMKPNPAMLVRALDDLSVEPGAAALIGDSARDIDAARAAGVPCIGYANRPDKRDQLAGADLIIDNMGTVAAALAGANRGSAAAGRE